MTRPLALLALLGFLGTLGCGGGDDPQPNGDANTDKPGPSAPDPRTPDDTMPDDTTPQLAVTRSDYGKLSDGTAIDQYTLTNTKGTRIEIITWGAIVTGVHLPDKAGESANVTLHWDDIAGWEKNPSYFGCIAGRYANRIAEGRFTLDGTEYQLTRNEKRGEDVEQILHGGDRGFDKRVWTAESVEREGTVGVKLTYVSADGEEGFPGELTATVEYTLNEANELGIRYEATTDAPTVVNLTNHCYWNLAGAGTGDALPLELELNCSQYVAVDPNSLIPTGELVDVEGTPFDFRAAKAVGAGIENHGEGFDFCFVVDGEQGTLRHVATLRDPESGRTMVIESTEPGVQFYTADHLDGGEANKGYVQHAGLCLETNHYPDSPNQPDFPSTVLRPGETYEQTTIHRFGLEE